MGMLFTVLLITLVVAVLGVVAFVLFGEPFVDHAERFATRAAEAWARAHISTERR